MDENPFQAHEFEHDSKTKAADLKECSWVLVVIPYLALIPFVLFIFLLVFFQMKTPVWFSIQAFVVLQFLASILGITISNVVFAEGSHQQKSQAVVSFVIHALLLLLIFAAGIA